MSNVSRNWVIWWALMRTFAAFTAIGFAAAVPAIIFTIGVLGGLSTLFGVVGLMGVIGCGIYADGSRVPWDDLTDKTAKMKLSRADRKELAKETSRIILESRIRELEQKNGIAS